MSVSENQLSQLDREMDQNHREMVIMSIEDFQAQAQFAQRTHGATQAPQVCTRTQGDMLTGTWQSVKSTYNGLPHTFVNTTWGVPTAMAAWDMKNTAGFIRDMNGLGTKVRYTIRNGKQYVILTGYPGLRKTLNAPRYGIQNAKLVSMGIGKYGVRGSSIKGFKLSCYVAVAIEVAEWVFADEHVMSDLFGGIGVELIKAGIASAIGYAFGLAIGSMATFAAAPVILGAAVVFAVGVGLNELDVRYGIKNSVKAGLRYAVDQIEYLGQQAMQISTKDLQKYAEKQITNIASEVADTLYNEAKRWALQKLRPGDLNLPGWPTVPELPSMPSLPTFNFPKF
ncbi:hypothetical protein PPUN12996_38690 [Pseudomonas putida]|uniref:hypothetical protein n=1 Tax=Pseudomonas TaxID=286 RepID=UPI000778C579|nr:MULTISPECIES: hypothetical protein [Pseudomonas]KYC14159.1 hypothetical protein WM94_26810 [Pseudomonas sp. ABFPK]MBA6113720.1 hypothetical protein [Pseudomonas asiatica]UPK86292.1 hypothetical protein E5221_15510 [Pseudomonas sp. A2]GLO31811.1 hypothetical protein PPUN12996_38690 [Pseudomonas putida]